MYAKKLKYAARDGNSYIALVQISGKKGGTPKMFVLYRYTVDYRSGLDKYNWLMFMPSVKTYEEALNYWLGEKKFPGWKDRYWQKTTSWLHEVSAGGGYQCYRDGGWAKIGKSAPWSKHRRKKRSLIFGDLSHILAARRFQLRNVESDLGALNGEIGDIEQGPEGLEYELLLLCEKREKLEAEFEAIYIAVMNTIDELRYKSSKFLGVPYWPRNPEHGTVSVPKTAS